VFLILSLTLFSSTSSETMNLIELRDPANAAAWRPVHDGVMGGLSGGRSSLDDGVVRFEGNVSLDNNGGFASFRATTAHDLADFDGARLRVRGDGHVYKLSLRTGDADRGIGWQAPFATRDGEWITVDLAFDDLIPSWRGRLVPDTGPFDASAIQEVGIVIADKQEGPFVLELDMLEAWRASEPATVDRTATLADAIDAGLDGRQLADAMRWSERIVVVAAPQELGARASVQRGHLLSRGPELADRQLRTVYLMGTRAGRMAGRTLTTEQVQSLRERWQLPPNGWQTALVGKDGGVKARWASPVDPDDIFALIDAMPMRRDEME
jgi:monofunctional biosynthetic peptidoglycan transglycosylase